MIYMDNKIKCVVFDLDGTLINTLTDLQNACEYVMQKHGYQASWTENDYKRFVGNGIRKLVERVFEHSLSEEALDKYLAEFLAYYDKTKLDNTDAYDGIKEQLAALKNKGIKIAVVTNKAEPAAIGILNTIFGKGTFDLIVGQREGLPTKPDPTGTLLALDTFDCTPEEALYFGDSNVDIQTAKNAKIKAIGVTWGFRSREELEAEGADVIIDHPSQIAKFF